MRRKREEGKNAVESKVDRQGADRKLDFFLNHIPGWSPRVSASRPRRVSLISLSRELAKQKRETALVTLSFPSTLHHGHRTGPAHHT
jgi:hypothetical protein